MANARHLDDLQANPIGSAKWMQAVHNILTDAVPMPKQHDHQDQAERNDHGRKAKTPPSYDPSSTQHS